MPGAVAGTRATSTSALASVSFLLLGLLAAIVYLSTDSMIVSGLAIASVATASAAALLIGPRWYGVERRWPWTLLAAACLAFLVGALFRPWASVAARRARVHRRRLHDPRVRPHVRGSGRLPAHPPRREAARAHRRPHRRRRRRAGRRAAVLGARRRCRGPLRRDLRAGLRLPALRRRARAAGHQPRLHDGGPRPELPVADRQHGDAARGRHGVRDHRPDRRADRLPPARPAVHLRLRADRRERARTRRCGTSARSPACRCRGGRCTGCCCSARRWRCRSC